MKPRKTFEIAFDPSLQPGYQTRGVSLAPFQGGANINPTFKKQTHETGDARNLQKVFNSGCVWQTLPSAKGKRA